jgi:hypothetical protein
MSEPTTTFLVIDTDKVEAFRAIYRAAGIRGLDMKPEQANEELGKGLPNADSSKQWFGSSRMTAAQAVALGFGRSDWLTIYTNDDFLDTWRYPDSWYTRR